MKYFSIKELSRSETANSRGIDNTPTQEAVVKLTNLVNKVLDPLREMYGSPIIVNSGFRCPKLNKVIGGAKNSDHMRGCAVDITAGNRHENEKLFDLIRKYLDFDQLIDESNLTWIHVSYRSKQENRNQILYL